MQLDGIQFSNYRLLRRVGGGGAGEVYLAEDVRHPERQLAIKIMHTSLAYDQLTDESREAIRLFQREIQAVIQLDHSRILPLYDAGEEKVALRDTPVTLQYIVMPYRPAGSLATWHKRSQETGFLSPTLVAHCIQQAGEALQHAHDRHIVHQDIKPSNFLLRNDVPGHQRPDLLLADFGCAKIANVTTQQTQTVRGTPPYMAPEQWNGRPVRATDQYGLAIMAYYLLTNRFPFQGELMQVIMQHMSTPPPPPGQFNPAIRPELDAVILRALAKKPEERFPSISDFARSFQQAAMLNGPIAYTNAQAPLAPHTPIPPAAHFPLSNSTLSAGPVSSPGNAGYPVHPVALHQERHDALPATPQHMTPPWGQQTASNSAAPVPGYPGNPVSTPGYGYSGNPVRAPQRSARKTPVVWLVAIGLVVCVAALSAIFVPPFIQNLGKGPQPSPTVLTQQDPTATAQATPDVTPTTGSQPTATPEPTSTPTLSPEEQGRTVVQQYYTYINGRNYSAAYALWKDYPGTEKEFSDGYANTVRDKVTFHEITTEPDGSVRVNITLVATERNGDILQDTTYVGYYLVGQDGATWKIVGGKISVA